MSARRPRGPSRRGHDAPNSRERYGLWFIESLEGAHELTFIQNKSHIIATYLWASYLHRVQIGILRFLPFAPCSGE